MYSFDEILRVVPYDYTVHHHGKAGTAGVGVRDIAIKPGSFKIPVASYSALIMFQKPARMNYNVSGNKPVKRAFLPGDLVVRPSDTQWDLEFIDNIDVTTIGLESAVVQSLTTAFNANVGETFGRLGVLPFRSSVLEGLINNLRAATVGKADRLYADAMTFALVHELWRLCSANIDQREETPGTLGAHTLRRIDEAIDASQGGHVALERLADMAGMSMVAFSAAMKVSNGLTPYQYVLSRRVIKARHLIETSSLSLAEIAFRCGFSSQSHMTDVFRAKLGATPGKLRDCKL